MKIKFCGIRRMEDVALMNEFKPDYVGFVFAESKRKVTKQTALVLSNKLKGGIKTVGVFVNEPLQNLLETAQFCDLDVVQLHGNEDENYIRTIRKSLHNAQIWKAVRVTSAEDILTAEKLPVDMLLLDSFSSISYGGTGKVANLSVIKETDFQKNFFLAGGLNSENISEILVENSPYGVDISSGIETDGYKDRNKILEIMRCLECLK